MRRTLIVLLLLLQTSGIFSQAVLRTEMRSAFHACSTGSKTDALYKLLSGEENSGSIVKGYLGAVTALKANYSYNPVKKYNYCKDGLNLLSQAIANSPNDLELRYLRILLQSKIPSFLGMNQNIKEDKVILLNKIGLEEDHELKQIISSFLLKSDICTDNEKKLLASR